MSDLMAELKELRLHGMVHAWEELAAQEEASTASSRWLLRLYVRSGLLTSKPAPHSPSTSNSIMRWATNWIICLSRSASAPFSTNSVSQCDSGLGHRGFSGDG